MYNDNILKSVAEAVKQVMEAELSAKQKQIAKIAEPKHKIDGSDLAALRAGKKPVKESGELGPKKDTKGKVVMVHKVNGKEMHVVNDPETIERHKKMGYKVFKTVKEEASQEEFTAEIKKAQAKSEGKEKAEVAKPAVVAVKQESVEKVDEAMVKGKGYDKPENERKAPEGKLSMTSLMPGYSDKAARFAAVQAKGKLVKGSAQSAKQMEKGMKKEEVEQIDESDLGNGYKIKMKHIDKGRIHSPSGEHVADVTRHKSGWQYHSGNSKWDGTEESPHYKTGVEKTKMAAARKAAQIHMKEEVEQIDEGLMGHIEVKPAKKVRDPETLAKHDVHYKGKKIGHIEVYQHRSGIKYGDHHDATGDGTAGHRSMNDAIGSLRLTHADHLKSMKEEVEQIDERTLTEPETAEKERLVKSMKKGIEGFKQRYGDRAKSVMYATATARAKENK